MRKTAHHIIVRQLSGPGSRQYTVLSLFGGASMTPMRDLLRFIAEHGGGFPVAQLSAEETRLALDCERELFLYRKRNSQSDDWCLTSKGLRAVADLNKYAVIKPTPPVSGDGR